jgi:hypothetical protein
MVISGGIVTPGSEQQETGEAASPSKPGTDSSLFGNGGAFKRKPRRVG